PIFALLYLIRWWQDRKLSFGHLALSLAIAGGITFVVIAACYGPETVRLTRVGAPPDPLAPRIAGDGWIRTGMRQAASFLNLPSYSYLVGLDTVVRHDRAGHSAYLLGQTLEKGGWWYYFPVAFAVKTPAAVLLLLLASLLIVAGYL